MPFGLKNASFTYQRLVKMMFISETGYTMEVYIDDMVFKSLHAVDHVKHLEIAFDILKIFMKLNPAKCSFGMSSCKFWDIRLQRGG